MASYTPSLITPSVLAGFTIAAAFTRVMSPFRMSIVIPLTRDPIRRAEGGPAKRGALGAGASPR